MFIRNLILNMGSGQWYNKRESQENTGSILFVSYAPLWERKNFSFKKEKLIMINY